MRKSVIHHILLAFFLLFLAGGHILAQSLRGVKILATEPRSGEPGVKTSAKITIIFDREMLPSGLNRFTVTVHDGISEISSEYVYDNKVLTLMPRGGLGEARKYTVTLNKGLAAEDGSILEEPFVFTFSTLKGPSIEDMVKSGMEKALPASLMPPPPPVYLELSSTDPVAYTEDISISTPIKLVFSMPLDEKTVNPFTIMVKDEAKNIPGSIELSSDGKTVTFLPNQNFENDTTHKVVITHLVHTTEGRRLRADHSFLFRTEKAPEVLLPQIISVIPENEAIDISPEASIAVNFNKSMKMETLNRFTITLSDGEQNIWGDILYNEGKKQAIFRPQGDLAGNRWHILKIRPGIEDADGYTVQKEHIYRFKTASVVVLVQPEPLVKKVDKVEAIAPIQDIIQDSIKRDPVIGLKDFVITRTSPPQLDKNAPVQGPFIIDFNRPCLPSTVNPFTVTLNDGRKNIWGTVEYDGKSYRAIFRPKEALEYSKDYSMLISDAITDIDGRRLGDSVKISFITELPPDREPPRILEIYPDPDSIKNDANLTITARFDEAIRPMSLNLFSFRLLKDNNSLKGTISYNHEDFTASFTPAQPLEEGIWYEAILGKAICDIAGNYIEEEKRWSFLAGEPLDKEPPYILKTSPVNNAIVEKNSPLITVEFNELLKTRSINPFTIHLHDQNGAEIHGKVTWSPLSLMARFMPLKPLKPGTYYGLVENKIEDLSGNKMANRHSWTFAISDPQEKGPAISRFWPENNSTGIPVEGEISLTFTRMMNPISFNQFTLKLGTKKGTVPVETRYNIPGATLTIIPKYRLEPGEEYILTILREIQDTSGANMTKDFMLKFTTETLANMEVDDLIENIRSVLPPKGEIK